MRRCTGFRPSRTSGSALATITLIAYSRNEALSSLETSISVILLCPGRAGLLVFFVAFFLIVAIVRNVLSYAPEICVCVHTLHCAQLVL